MSFAAAVGHRSGRATPSLRDAPQRQSMEIVGRETIYRNRNAVQTNPATSHHTALAETARELHHRPRIAGDQQMRFVPAMQRSLGRQEHVAPQMQREALLHAEVPTVGRSAR